MKLRAVFHEAEEGGYWAEVPALPGCMTQGETLEELKQNLEEAVQGWLAAGDLRVEEGSGEILEVAV